MHLPAALSRRLLGALMPLLLASPAVLAQTSTVVVIPTPLLWQDAMALCGQMGHSIYPVPATPTDPVYKVLEEQPEDRFWISRRTGQSCTCLNKNGAAGDLLLEEAPAGSCCPRFARGAVVMMKK